MEQRENPLIQMYYDKFGVFPPVLATVEWEDDLYLDLIQVAITNNKPLEEKEVADIFSKIGFDVINNGDDKKFANFSKTK